MFNKSSYRQLQSIMLENKKNGSVLTPESNCSFQLQPRGYRTNIRRVNIHKDVSIAAGFLVCQQS